MTKWKKSLSKMDVTEWAFYDIDPISDPYGLKLSPPSSIEFPINALIYPKEVWIFFPDLTDFVAFEITADWSEKERQGRLISGGEMYAFENYHLRDLPQKRPDFLQWGERPHYCAKIEIEMDLNETKLLIINKQGITGVMIKTWERGGMQDNSISIDGIYKYDAANTENDIPQSPSIVSIS